jgi:hypothetical protein
MSRRKIGVVLLVLALAGTLVSASSAAAPDTKKMVLTLADLPAGFSLDKGYYASNARAAKESANTPLAQFIRWGRINGYEADFSRSSSSGILQITSRTSTYKTAKGATDSTHESFKAEGTKQKMMGQTVVFKRISTGARIGHEARMYAVEVKSEGISVIAYGLIWRYQTVKAAVLVAGISGTVDAADVVKLAQKQQARIAAATTASASVSVTRPTATGGTPAFAGTPHKVTVVKTGVYGNTLPVLIKNNTPVAVKSIKLSGMAYTGGKLVVTGSDQGIQPAVVPPGELAFGYVYFNGKKLAPGTKFKINVSSKPASQDEFIDTVDVPLTSVRYAGGNLVGIGVNPSKKKISGPLSVYAICIDAAKQIVKLETGSADADDLPPKGQAPFTLDLTSYGTAPAPKCRYLLVSMTGYDF